MAFIDRLPLGQRPAVHNWECDDNTDRDALTEESAGVLISADSIGKEVRVGTASPYAYYRLEGVAPLVWSRDLGAAPGAGGGGGVTVHGDLTGLDADDHPQYALAASMTTALAGKADTTALTSGLAAKANTSHAHVIADTTGLQTALDAKADTTALTAGLATKADATHTHVIADTTGLQTALDAKADSSALTSGLAGKADTSHTQATSTITGLDATLAALATTTSLTSGLATKAAVRAEKGFVTSRAVTASTTAVDADSGNAVDMNSSSGMNFTVNNGTGAENDLITIFVISTGVVTLVAGSNVSIVAPPGKTLVSTAAGSWVQLRKRVTGVTDIWMATGHLA